MKRRGCHGTKDYSDRNYKQFEQFHVYYLANVDLALTPKL